LFFVAESLFRTIKSEEIYSRFYKTADELFDSVAEYIEFFNNKRPHQKYAYRTPIQVETDYYKA
jgi:putative transposase